MAHKRGRRHTIPVTANRPTPEPSYYGKESVDGEFVHRVGFNLALFSPPEQRLIRDELKVDDISRVVTKGNMLHIDVRTKSALPGDALLKASKVLTSIITRLEESSWRPLRRVAATQG